MLRVRGLFKKTAFNTSSGDIEVQFVVTARFETLTMDDMKAIRVLQGQPVTFIVQPEQGELGIKLEAV